MSINVIFKIVFKSIQQSYSNDLNVQEMIFAQAHSDDHAKRHVPI